MRTPILIIFLFGFSIIYDVEAYPAKHEPADNSVYGIQHCVNMTQENEEKISTIVTKLSEFLYNLALEHEVFDIRLLKIVIEGHSDDEVEEKDTQVQLVVNDCAQANEFADGEELEEVLDEEDPYEKKGTIRVNFADRENEQSETKDDDSNKTQTVAINDNITNANETNDEESTTTEDNATREPDADNNNAENTNNNAEDINNDEESTTTDDNATTEPDADNNNAENTNNNAEDTNNDEESKTNDQTTAFDQSEYYSTDNAEPGKSKIDIDDIEPSSSANYEVPGPVLVRLDLDKNGNKLIRGTQMKRGEHVPLLLYVQRALGNVEYLFAN